MYNIWKTGLIFSLFLIVFLSISCGKQNFSVPAINEALAYSFAEKNASIVPRNSGSTGAEKSFRWIKAEAEKLKKFKTSAMEFDDMTSDGIIRFKNIVSEIRGKSSKIIVIGAHYDTKKFNTFEFVGANDGASGVAALLAMMHAIEKFPEKPPFTLRFVFFDGEECIDGYTEKDGLHGSKKSVELWTQNGYLEKIHSMILLDMIGDKELSLTIPQNSNDELVELAFHEAERLGYKKHFHRYHGEILDDHVPFAKKGVPTINMIDFEYGPDNCYWHTSADTMDKISGESIKIVADTVLSMIWHINKN